jgi:pimeloyl-ACP methyl ester carboxylesterase
VKLVLIPGWNEGAGDMRILIDGRHKKPGFAHAGFDCTVFSEASGDLRERIEQFAAVVARLGAGGERVAVLGYSAGGLIARGYLRAYPERAEGIGGTYQVGAPNAGVVTDDVGHWLRMLGIQGDVIDDLDIESDFMRWLNGTLGHWETDRDGHKHWRLDHGPWVAPRGARIFNLVGRPPRYAGDGDGVVLVDSATLNGAMPHAFIDVPSATHLNLAGLSNFLMLVFRRWIADDRVWPRVVERATEFFRAS